jgi:hypothetical protein
MIISVLSHISGSIGNNPILLLRDNKVPGNMGKEICSKLFFNQERSMPLLNFFNNEKID